MVGVNNGHESSVHARKCPPRRRLHITMLNCATLPAPRRALSTADRAQKCMMLMSVTTQIIFPCMSDARPPAMDIQMAPQGAGMALSF